MQIFLETIEETKKNEISEECLETFRSAMCREPDDQFLVWLMVLLNTSKRLAK